MQCEVTVRTRRSADVVMSKPPETKIGDAIRLGRGTDNEVQLSDIRVGLHAAVLRQRETGLFLDASENEAVRVNGAAVTATAPVKPGDKISIGPYLVEMVPPPAGFDAAITVELVQPLGDALERLTAQNKVSLVQAGWSKRRWSWILFSLVAILGLALPIVVYPLGNTLTSAKSVPSTGFINLVSMAWNPGEISNSHRFFAQDCATCHRGAFASVPDAACLSCHTNIGSHVEASADLGPLRSELDTTRCTSCHEEHRGVHSLVIEAQALCVDCHEGLADRAPKSGVADVSSFPSGHPQFRATLVADAAKPSFVRKALGTTPPPMDNPDFNFSHAAHLIKTGFLTPQGHKVMTCADCHVPDPSGQGFMAITFEQQCHSCHDLKFDADLPFREVPHGDAGQVVSAVQDFYAHQALQGGVQDPDAPAFSRRAVGVEVVPTPEQRAGALAWAKARADTAMGIIFDPKRGCAYCHVTSQSGGNFTVVPPVLRTRFLPEAEFDHSKHRALDCADCHAAQTSDKASDVLIPGIESCVSCHGAERADLKTQSTCTSCHVFHREEFGPMRTAKAGP